MRPNAKINAAFERKGKVVHRRILMAICGSSQIEDSASPREMLMATEIIVKTMRINHYSLALYRLIIISYAVG
jgi:hypothetical protein